MPLEHTVSREGTVLLGTPASAPDLAALPIAADLGRAGNEGYVLRAVRLGGRRVIVVAAIGNLVKGAAGQAVQNMNVMCGFPENTALEGLPLFP